MDGDERRRLPMWRIVIDAYRATFENWRYAIRISWVWFVPIVVLAIVIDLLELNDSQLYEITALFLGLVSIVPVSSLAVAWHRKLLREETYQDAIYLRLDLTVWRYFIYATLLFLFAAIFFFTAFMTAKALETSVGPAVFFALWAVIPVLAIVLLLRLSVMLPGLALDEKHISFKETWRRTRGNSLRIVFGTMLCIFLPAIATSPIGILLGDFETRLSFDFVASTLITEATFLLIGFIGLSFLSFSYRFFYAPERLRAEDAKL